MTDRSGTRKDTCLKRDNPGFEKSSVPLQQPRSTMNFCWQCLLPGLIIVLA